MYKLRSVRYRRLRFDVKTILKYNLYTELPVGGKTQNCDQIFSSLFTNSQYFSTQFGGENQEIKNNFQGKHHNLFTMTF